MGLEENDKELNKMGLEENDMLRWAKYNIS